MRIYARDWLTKEFRKENKLREDLKKVRFDVNVIR